MPSENSIYFQSSFSSHDFTLTYSFLTHNIRVHYIMKYFCVCVRVFSWKMRLLKKQIRKQQQQHHNRRAIL